MPIKTYSNPLTEILRSPSNRLPQVPTPQPANLATLPTRRRIPQSLNSFSLSAHLEGSLSAHLEGGGWRRTTTSWQRTGTAGQRHQLAPSLAPPASRPRLSLGRLHSTAGRRRLGAHANGQWQGGGWRRCASPPLPPPPPSLARLQASLANNFLSRVHANQIPRISIGCGCMYVFSPVGSLVSG
jgi:hypothetical protein